METIKLSITSALLIGCIASCTSSTPKSIANEPRIINVADHGITPGRDVSLQVSQLIKSLEGQSEFYPDNAYEQWRAVSNHDNSLRRMAIPIFNMKNVTIKGNGSTFMFHGHISPIIVEDSENVTLENFFIDWQRPFQNEMTVVEIDPEADTFIAEMDAEKYPYEIKNGRLFFNYYDWQDPVGSNMAFDPTTRSPIYDTRSYSLKGQSTKVSNAGKNRIKFHQSTRKMPPVGTVFTSYGVHPTSRLAQVIHLHQSNDTLIENVTVYAGGGMGIIAERCDNITLNGFVVTSTDDRMISTRADATHFINCKGTILLENCLFEHMLDDGINVHGAYIKIEEILQDNQLLCEISHFQQTGLIFGEPGEKVALLSRKTIQPFHQTEITDVRILNEDRMIITVAELPADLPEGPLSIENLTWNPDLIMRDNIIRENRARSVLVTTKGKVLLENNYFSSQMHGILIEGDNNKWYESGGVQDVTIRNNTFVNIGYEVADRYPLFAAPLLNETQHYGEGHYHRNINFVNNTIRSFNGHFVHAFSVKGLNITGNTIEFSEDYPPQNDYPSIDLIYSADVTIKDNKVTGFSKPLTLKKSEDSSNITFENNEGFGSP